MAIAKEFWFAHAQMVLLKILSHDQNKYGEHKALLIRFPCTISLLREYKRDDFLGKLKHIIRADIPSDLYKINYKSKRVEAAFSNLSIFCQTRSPDQIFPSQIVNPISVPMI